MTRARLAVLALTTTAAISSSVYACGGDEEAGSTSAATETTTPTAAQPSELRRRFEDEMRAVLEQQRTRVDPGCVIERLREDLPNATVEASVGAIEAGEEIPEQAVDAAFAAGQECRRR